MSFVGVPKTFIKNCVYRDFGPQSTSPTIHIMSHIHANFSVTSVSLGDIPSHQEWLTSSGLLRGSWPKLKWKPLSSHGVERRGLLATRHS